MKRRRAIQYTIRNIPERMDMLLRENAVKDRVSLNEETLSVLSKGLGLANEATVCHDLDDLAGTWVEDPEFDRAIQDMSKVDPELWK